MAEYQDRSGYNVGIVGGAGGSEPPDTIEAQWIRKLERDLWIRFWGPGPDCSDWDDKNEYDRAMGWNQSASYDAGTSGSGVTAEGMGDLQGHPEKHTEDSANTISTTDPRDAIGYGKYTVRQGTNITNASKEDPCVVTCATAHGLLDEDPAHEGSPTGLSVPNEIQIVGVPDTSMYQLNELHFFAKVISATELELYTNADLAPEHSYDATQWQVWAGTEGWVNFVVDFESGTGNTGNYERTTTIARDQYHAIQQRINAAIKRTAVSTFATGSSKKTLDLVQSTYGAMKKTGGDDAGDINEDMGRVRDAHVNAMSAEIELIGAPLDTTSLGSYNFHKLHVNGIYSPYTVGSPDGTGTPDHDLGVYSENRDQAYGTFSNAWGSDTWSNSGQSAPPYNIPWSTSGGSEYGNDRPFLEARMTFNDWNHMRYWFNQGGCCLFWPDFTGTNDWGSHLWEHLARANTDTKTSKIFAGQFAPYHENAALISSGQITFHQGGSGNGYGVTADCPRVHGLGDKANAYFAGTGGGTTNGTTITGLSTGNMAPNDILHLGSWIGDIELIDSGSQVTLHRNIRQINGTEYDNATHGNLSGLAWACSKWYRACQYNGGGGLYGDNATFPNDESLTGDGGWIHFDWRFVKDPGNSSKPCIFYRMMYDNSGNHCTVHGTGTMRLGSRWPDTVDYFYPEQGSPPAVTSDHASTAEDRDGLNRTN